MGPPDQQKTGPDYSKENTAEAKKAAASCADKEPYLDPKYTKEGNPKFAEQTIAWMDCLNKAGVPVSGKWDAEFFKFGEVKPGVNRGEVMRQCYIEAYK
jgi:hypothetical protein